MSRLEKLLDSKIRGLNLHFFSDYLKQLEEMYESALELTSHYDREIAKLAAAYNRDWLANQKLYETSHRHDDVKAKYVKNRTGGHKHAEIILNGAIVTVSQVKHKDEFVRDAKFRQSLARKYSPTLFDPIPTIDSIDSNIYAIILHGIISDDNERPAFARIVIPNYETGKYDYNESLFKICGLKEPTALDEPVIEQIKEENAPTIKKIMS